MTDGTDGLNRRGLIQLAGAGATGLILGGNAAAAGVGAAPGLPPPSPVDSGTVQDGRVHFPAWHDPADTPSAPTPAPLPPEERVGFAVVGLGRLALDQIMPAFGRAMKARPVALVSGSPDKLATVARQYGIKPEACYDYAGFDRIRDNPEIKAVYIVLPNALHREYTERAARAGKHVLCEKPMSVTAADARAMVAACERAGVRLMIAYRIQYEPHNRRAMGLVRSRAYGKLVGFSGINTQTVAADGAQQWRHKKALAGGGSLFDIGLYCLNTARFLTGEEPVEISAFTHSAADDPRFAQVEETVSFTLRFPSDAIANCFTSYGARDDKHQRLNLQGAAIDMPNAYQYQGQRLSVISRQGDVTGNDELAVPPRDQFALELDHMAECVMTGRKPYTPGEEGVQDHVLMEAIYESARSGRPVRMKPVATPDAFRGPPPDERA